MICDMIKYENAVDDFLDNLRNTGASEKTVCNYASRLRLFGSYFQENGKNENPTYNDVKAWRNSLNAMVTPHQLRHAYCTILYEVGVDELSAMQLMGHSDFQTTRKIHTHLRQKHMSEVAQKLENAFK